MEPKIFLRSGTPNDDNREYLPEAIKLPIHIVSLSIGEIKF